MNLSIGYYSAEIFLYLWIGSDVTNAPVIITVHGTGAGEASIDTPKWRQAESKFNAELLGKIGSEFDIQAFKWSGNNSERDRRKAGKELFSHILELEVETRDYHLVGHSHGGSVIWHALQYAARKSEKLDQLRSVNTIGTPFMEYRANLSFLLLPLILIFGMLPLVFSEILKRDIYDWFLILRNASGFSLSLFLVLLAACFILLFILVARCIFGIFAWYRCRSALFYQQEAQSRHGEKFQIIYHELDEPISGLLATTKTSARLLGKATDHGGRSIWPRTMAVCSNLVLSIANEFAWRTLVRKIQGSDVMFEDLAKVVACPEVLANAEARLGRDLVTQMEQTSLENSFETVREIRRKLANAAPLDDAQESLNAMATAISWSAVIHNSYFDFATLRELIFEKIDRTGATKAVSRQNDSIGPVSYKVLASSPGGISNISIVTAVLTAVGLSTVFLMISLIDRTSFQSLTNKSTVTKVVEYFTNPDAVGYNYNPFNAEGYVRSYAMGYVDLSELKYLEDENSRLLIEQRLAFALGFKNDIPTFKKVLRPPAMQDDPINDLLEIPKMFREYILLAFFIAGNLDQSTKPDNEIYQLFSNVAETASLHGTRTRTLLVKLAPFLVDAVGDKYLETFLVPYSSGGRYQCEIAVQAAMDIDETVQSYVSRICESSQSRWQERQDLDNKVSTEADLPPPPNIKNSSDPFSAFKIDQSLDFENALINFFGTNYYVSNQGKDDLIAYETWRESWQNARLRFTRILSEALQNEENARIKRFIDKAFFSDQRISNLSSLSCFLARSGNYNFSAVAAERAGPYNDTGPFPINYAGTSGGYAAILTEELNRNPTKLARELGLLSPNWHWAPLAFKAKITEFPQHFQSPQEYVRIQEAPGHELFSCYIDPLS